MITITRRPRPDILALGVTDLIWEKRMVNSEPHTVCMDNRYAAVFNTHILIKPLPTTGNRQEGPCNCQLVHRRTIRRQCKYRTFARDLQIFAGVIVRL